VSHVNLQLGLMHSLGLNKGPGFPVCRFLLAF